MTGFPWQVGDALLAADLNSAFLPLTGGTISTPASMPNQIVITPVAAQSANAPNGAQFASYLTTQLTAPGGFNDPIYSNVLVNSTINGVQNSGVWNLYGAVTYTGSGGNGGHVASAGQAVRATQNAGGTANNPQMWGALFQLRRSDQHRQRADELR